MTNEQGNPSQHPWPQQPADQQPYAPQPAQQPTQQPYGQPTQQPYGQPAQQPYGQPAPQPGQPQYPGAPQYPGQGQQPGQPFGGPAEHRPKRSLREPLVGAIAVVAVAIALSILNTLGNLTFGFGLDYVGQTFVFFLLPIAFAALAFVGAAFVSPIERATTRPAFLRSALIAGGLGAAALFLLTTVFSMFDTDFLGSFVRSAVVGTISQSVQYLAVFIAAILLDRLGRARTA